MSALMSNWDIAESALQSSINSQGSAERELSNHQKGIESSVGKFKAQFQDFSNTVLDSSVLKTGVDIGTGLLSGITGVISAVGLPGLIAGGIGGKSFFKNLD